MELFLALFPLLFSPFPTFFCLSSCLSCLCRPPPPPFCSSLPLSCLPQRRKSVCIYRVYEEFLILHFCPLSLALPTFSFLVSALATSSFRDLCSLVTSCWLYHEGGTWTNKSTVEAEVYCAQCGPFNGSLCCSLTSAHMRFYINQSQWDPLLCHN